ncbi:MAG: DUF1998 domain-containing protein [Desulfobacteraceae bacterium]|nr:DUF1998 domain-containing protein [Desulfobacteraceae bacterium]
MHPIENGDGIDLCELCRTSLEAPITSLFRLQNVSTKRRDRINSDEEERRRLGYTLKIGFRFAEHGGRPSHKTASIIDDAGKAIATLTYGHGAKIWRINLGWARKKENSPDGFLLDIEQGYWVSENRLKEVEENFEENALGRINRVIPYVEDHKNCLIFEPADDLSNSQIASLEAAVKSAIQTVYQLEESELASEALPDKAQRKVILFYEASEGGAGILKRLIEDASALPFVARCAMEHCHFDPETETDLGAAPSSKENCEAACYNCLMSFSNQPDHPLLDRKSIKEFLGILARAKVRISPKGNSSSKHLEQLLKNTDSNLEREWLRLLERLDMRLPSHAQKLIEKCRTRPDFFYDEYQTAIYIDGPVHEYPNRAERDKIHTECMEDYGYSVIRFRNKENWESVIKQYPHIFGINS